MLLECTSHEAAWEAFLRLTRVSAGAPVTANSAKNEFSRSYSEIEVVHVPECSTFDSDSFVETVDLEATSVSTTVVDGVFPRRISWVKGAWYYMVAAKEREFKRDVEISNSLKVLADPSLLEQENLKLAVKKRLSHRYAQKIASSSRVGKHVGKAEVCSDHGNIFAKNTVVSSPAASDDQKLFTSRSKD